MNNIFYHKERIKIFVYLCVTLCITLWYNPLFSQPSSDNQFAKPLKDVLNDIQKKYGVTIKYADSMVANKKVTYADWKYRSDVEVTLDNVLKPLELKVKKEKDKQKNLILQH